MEDPPKDALPGVVAQGPGLEGAAVAELSRGPVRAVLQPADGEAGPRGHVEERAPLGDGHGRGGGGGTER